MGLLALFPWLGLCSTAMLDALAPGSILEATWVFFGMEGSGVVANLDLPFAGTPWLEKSKMTGTISAASLFLRVSWLLAPSADLRCFLGEYVWDWVSMIFLEREGGCEEFGAGLAGLGSCGRVETRRIARKAGETESTL